MRLIKATVIIVFLMSISACRASTGGDNVISSQSSDIPSRNEVKADQDDVKATQKSKLAFEWSRRRRRSSSILNQFR